MDIQNNIENLNNSTDKSNKKKHKIALNFMFPYLF